MHSQSITRNIIDGRARRPGHNFGRNNYFHHEPKLKTTFEVSLFAKLQLNSSKAIIEVQEINSLLANLFRFEFLILKWFRLKTNAVNWAALLDRQQMFAKLNGRIQSSCDHRLNSDYGGLDLLS